MTQTKAFRFRGILSVLLAVLLLLSAFTFSVGAKNVCDNISGSFAEATTFTVSTGSRFLFKDKITLKQTKGTAITGRLTSTSNIYKEKERYGAYNISVTKTSGGDKGKHAYTTTWGATKSISLKLQRNAEYEITVTPFDQTSMAFINLAYGGHIEFKRNPTWSVVKTKGITLCEYPE